MIGYVKPDRSKEDSSGSYGTWPDAVSRSCVRKKNHWNVTAPCSWRKRSRRKDVAVEHILADGELETHASAMDRLLTLHDDPRQEDLFGHRDERIARAIAKQTERIAYKNKTPSAS